MVPSLSGRHETFRNHPPLPCGVRTGRIGARSARRPRGPGGGEHLDEVLELGGGVLVVGQRLTDFMEHRLAEPSSQAVDGHLERPLGEPQRLGGRRRIPGMAFEPWLELLE